jgi:hypothetical protein
MGNTRHVFAMVLPNWVLVTGAFFIDELLSTASIGIDFSTEFCIGAEVHVIINTIEILITRAEVLEYVLVKVVSVSLWTMEIGGGHSTEEDLRARIRFTTNKYGSNSIDEAGETGG